MITTFLCALRVLCVKIIEVAGNEKTGASLRLVLSFGLWALGFGLSEKS